MSKTFFAALCSKIKMRLDIISIVIGILGFNVFSASSSIIGWYTSLSTAMQIAFFGILNMIWTLCVVVAFTEAPTKEEIINIAQKTPPAASPQASAPASTLISTPIPTSNQDAKALERDQ